MERLAAQLKSHFKLSLQVIQSKMEYNAGNVVILGSLQSYTTNKQNIKRETF